MVSVQQIKFCVCDGWKFYAHFCSGLMLHIHHHIVIIIIIISIYYYYYYYYYYI